MLTLMGAWMGQMEIAERLGVTRQRVQQLIARSDWPKPEIVLAMGKIWATRDIEAWITEHRPDVAATEPAPDTGPVGKRHHRNRAPKKAAEPPPAPDA